MTKQPKKATPNKKDGAKAGTNWDPTDESSSESFPASDPPASWAGRDIAPEDRKTPKSS